MLWIKWGKGISQDAEIQEEHDGAAARGLSVSQSGRTDGPPEGKAQEFQEKTGEMVSTGEGGVQSG